MMRIAQITDLHIGGEGENPQGVNVRANFLKLLASVRRFQPAHLVVSGDLCVRDGERAIYQWIKAHLDDLHIPYELISGNHDDPVLMAEVFGRQSDCHEDGLYFARHWAGWPVLFLDTTHGVLPESQRDWLREQLGQHDRPVIIFMHHPPFRSGVPHMDNRYALENREDVQEILFAHRHPITIFTGHYHVDKVVNHRNVQVYITPSAYFQIDQHQEKFQVDHYRPGLREITLNGERILHSVVYP